MKKKLISSVLVVFLLQWIPFVMAYSSEQIDAYNYAYNQWITTAKSIDKAKIEGSLDRIAMAKMVSNFAINVLGLQPNKSLNCVFADVSDELDAQYGYWVTKVCQLWLMWISDDWKKSVNFYPKWEVKRWQRATVFSRALSKFNWDQVEEVSPYYKVHLEYLNSKWIIKNIDKPLPNSIEKRWNVMIMMHRVSQNVTDYEDENLVGEFKNNISDNSEENFMNLDEKVINDSNDDNMDKSEIEEAETIFDNEVAFHRVSNSYNQFIVDDFNSVEDVYKNIKSGDRVIFLVRHSERITDCTSEWWLTENGIELAKWVWVKLKGAPFEDTSSDFYGSSTVKRTVQTSYYVGESRGSEVLKNVINSDNWAEYEFVNHTDDINSVIYGEYFSDGNTYSSIENLYEENKSVVNERALKTINRLCELTDWHPFSWITSHDWVVLPITERATREKLSFNPVESEWPNFMQWVAIVVHKDWWWEIYPVKSLENWKIKTRENPGC